MLIFKNTKSTYQQWYQQNKQRLSEKRKKLYADNPEYRERAMEASKRYRRGERTLPIPADTEISFAQAADRLGIGTSTLREWRRKKLFPEPKHHNRGLWFTENQVSLLNKLKDFFKVYRMRPWKIKRDRLKELREFIGTNWN
jgi:MerR HTH family regulatory protein